MIASATVLAVDGAIAPVAVSAINNGSCGIAPEWCTAFDAKFGERQVDGAAIGTDNEAITTLKAEFSIGWVDGLTVGTTHGFPVFRFVYAHW